MKEGGYQCLLIKRCNRNLFGREEALGGRVVSKSHTFDKIELFGPHI